VTTKPPHATDGSSGEGAIDAAVHTIEIEPHCSLSRRGAVVFVASAALTSFAVAGLCAAYGFWPVLPFAGIEIAVLAWAVWLSMARVRLRERITIGVASIVIDLPRSATQVRSVFPRHWARVKLHGPRTALHSSRLTIESRGRAREVGRFLTEAERRALASRLKLLVGNVNESPALGCHGASVDRAP
jgi:uncharacterized membrane protein